MGHNKKQLKRMIQEKYEKNTQEMMREKNLLHSVNEMQRIRNKIKIRLKSKKILYREEIKKKNQYR